MTAGDTTSSSPMTTPPIAGWNHRVDCGQSRGRARAGRAGTCRRRSETHAADDAQAPRSRSAPPGARGDRPARERAARCRESIARRSPRRPTRRPSTRAAPAFMSPMISSSANSTAATGVLNAAASAPAAPTGTSSRTRSGDSRSHRPTTEAMPAPICTEGPSRPIEWPDPMQSTPVRNLPIGTRAG